MGQRAVRLLVTLTALASLQAIAASSDLIITSAFQEISLNTQVTIIGSQYHISNQGSKAVDEFLYCVAERHAEHLAFLEAVQGDPQVGDQPELKAEPVLHLPYPQHVSCHKLTLADPVPKGGTTLVDTYAVFTKLVYPKPAEIAQGETQHIVFEGHHFILSPYAIQSQTTKVKLPSSNVESYSKEQPTALSGSTITYGPYSNKAPWDISAQTSRMSLHYENNSPFLEALSLTRDIEVSHWGNVYVEERYVLKHTGAKHKGTWSRLDYMTKSMMGPSSVVADFKAVLPAGAHSLYYKDGIGNISTSHTRHQLGRVEVDLRPRYPLLGGWQVEFIFGYSLPLQDVVKKTASGQYELSLQFSPPIAGLVVRDMDIKVAVPEGSSKLQADAPVPVTQSSEKRFTYLDIVGRPVLVLHAANVVAIANDVLTVTYSLPSINLLLEPGLLVTAFLAVFGVVVVCSRCELSLGPGGGGSHGGTRGGAGGPAVRPAAETVGQFSSLLAERQKVLASLDTLPMGSSKDDVKRAAEAQLKDINRQLRQLGPELEASTGFQQSSYQMVLSKEQALQKATLQRFDGRSYTGSSYTHSQDNADQLDLLDSKVNDLKAEMTMMKNLISQALFVGGGSRSS